MANTCPMIMLIPARPNKTVCTARHDCPVATRAVSEILGPAVEAAAPPTGSPDHSHRNSPLNRANGGRQSIVACAADSRRTEDARDPDLRAHRLPDSSKASPAAQSDLEDFPAQSPGSDGLHRFFHGADHQHEGAIRILRAGTSTSRGVALWCDRTSDRGLDVTADCGS